MFSSSPSLSPSIRSLPWGLEETAHITMSWANQGQHTALATWRGYKSLTLTLNEEVGFCFYLAPGDSVVDSAVDSLLHRIPWALPNPSLKILRAWTCALELEHFPSSTVLPEPYLTFGCWSLLLLPSVAGWCHISLYVNCRCCVPSLETLNFRKQKQANGKHACWCARERQRAPEQEREERETWILLQRKKNHIVRITKPHPLKNERAWINEN